MQFPFLGHGAIAAAKREGKPVVMSFHVQPENILSNLGITRWLTAYVSIFCLAVLRPRDCVIAPSQFAAGLLREAGLTKPVTVISNHRGLFYCP